MTDTIIGACIGVGGAIIGVILAGPITYIFSKKLITETHKNAIDLIHQQEFNKAAAEFRNAFIIQLNFLKSNVNSGTGDTSNIGEYLGAHYVGSHLKAFEVFKCYLSPREIEAISKAWEEYRDFAQYSDKNNQKGARELALKNIEGVLKFAKHK